MFGVTVIALTSVVGYRYYNQPQLGVGSRAPSTIYAPADGEFLDGKTTEERRKEVRTGIVPRLQREEQLTATIHQNTNQVLAHIDQFRRLGAPFPYLSIQTLNLLQQQYLRSCPESEWQTLKQALSLGEPAQNMPSNLASLYQALQETTATLSSAQRQALVQAIEKARQRYALAQKPLEADNLALLSPKTLVTALTIKPSLWTTIQADIRQAQERMLTQGLPGGISRTLLQETIQANLSGTQSREAKQVAEEILFVLLQDQYNLVIDTEATKRQAERAAQAVQPIVVTTKQGEVIIQAGQVIEQPQFVLLDGFGLSQRGINWSGLLQTAGVTTGVVLIFGALTRIIHRPLRRRDHILLLALSLTGPASALIDPYYMTLPAIGLLGSSYYGPTLAIAHVLLVGGMTGYALAAPSETTTDTINWEYLIAGMAAGVLAGSLAGRLRSRDELARLGVGVGLVQGGVYLIGYLILSATPTTVWYALLPGALIYGSLGTLWIVVAIGISPYLERFFDVVTPIRLVELSNPNCPLLQRLAKEAPGTFQHTLFVACLAESAARELRCNVELVRAGTLYHDIGKMHDPLGFIENQMGGPNKHDLIANPQQSTQIIKAHVSEGLEMARKYGLPKVVRDFIPEHQGTMLISYFYHQAKEKAALQGAEAEAILEADFRYDGPIPQSRETGIVMLADSSEAALRSLKDANPEVALAMVNRIFKARWRDNQLQNSGLKYEELPIIAEVFVRVWQQFHHQRIMYPQAALETPAVASPSIHPAH
ncbi:hypothetical protein OLK001_28060 [Synechocystis sp. LKSZ1]